MVIELVHHGSSSIQLVLFLGHPVYMIVVVHRDTGKNALDCGQRYRDRDMHAKNQKFRAHQVNKNTKTQPSISMYIRHVVSSNIDKIRYA